MAVMNPPENKLKEMYLCQGGQYTINFEYLAYCIFMNSFIPSVVSTIYEVKNCHNVETKMNSL